MFSFFCYPQNRNSSRYSIPTIIMKSHTKINVSMLSLKIVITISTRELHYAREGCCEDLPLEDIPPRILMLGCICSWSTPFFAAGPPLSFCFHSWEWKKGAVQFPTAVCAVLSSSPVFLGSKLLQWIDSLACFGLPRTDKLLVVVCWWGRNGFEVNTELNNKFQSLKINIFLKLSSAGV